MPPQFITVATHSDDDISVSLINPPDIRHALYTLLSQIAEDAPVSQRDGHLRPVLRRWKLNCAQKKRGRAAKAAPTAFSFPYEIEGEHDPPGRGASRVREQALRRTAASVGDFHILISGSEMASDSNSNVTRRNGQIPLRLKNICDFNGNMILHNHPADIFPSKALAKFITLVPSSEFVAFVNEGCQYSVANAEAAFQYALRMAGSKPTSYLGPMKALCDVIARQQIDPTRYTNALAHFTGAFLSPNIGGLHIALNQFPEGLPKSFWSLMRQAIKFYPFSAIKSRLVLQPALVTLLLIT